MTVGTVFGGIRRSVLLLSFVVGMGALPVASFGPRPHIAFRESALKAPRVVHSSIEFRMAGVSWSERAPDTVHVRTSTDGRRFGEWTELDIDRQEQPDGGTVRSTAPLWVGRARHIEVRWAGRARGVKVSVIDPGPDPAVPRASASASPGQPSIIARSQWGADERIRKCCPAYAEPLQMLFIHHTATGNSYSKSDSAAIVRSIYTYHVKTNGWNDIGYNFLVDRYGQIFEGRYGGITRSVVGAHSLGFNSHSSGIAVIGTYGSSSPPSSAVASVERLAAWRLDDDYIDPASSTTMTSGGNPRYAAGRRVSLRTISGHRDVYTTDCPGTAFYNQLATIRSTVAMIGDPKVYSPRPSRPIITPNGDGVADTTTLTARFSRPVSWSVAVLDRGGRTWSRGTGSGDRLSFGWNGKDPTGKIAPHDVYRFVINARNSHGSMRPATVPVSVWRYPDGTLFRTSSGWMGILKAGRLGHVVALRPLQTRYRERERVAAPNGVWNLYRSRPEFGFRDGSLVRADKTYVISDGTRRPISSSTLTALGFDPRAIIDTNGTALAPTPVGPSVAGTYPNGVAVKGTDSREAMFASSVARPFVTANVRDSYAIRNVDLAGPADPEINAGSASRPLAFRDGTLIRVAGTTTVYVIANGKRRSFPTRHLFDVMGYDMTNVRTVTPAELAINPDGGPL